MLVYKSFYDKDINFHQIKVILHREEVKNLFRKKEKNAAENFFECSATFFSFFRNNFSKLSVKREIAQKRLFCVIRSNVLFL